jgi:hypothetical protein
MRQLGSNGFNPDQLNEHLSIIDEADDELATLLGGSSCLSRGRLR